MAGSTEPSKSTIPGGFFERFWQTAVFLELEAPSTSDMHGHTSDISDVIRSRDGGRIVDRVVTTADDGGAIIWEIPRDPSGRWTFRGKFPHDGRAGPLFCERSDGPILITGAGTEAEIWDTTDTREPLASLRQGTTISRMVSSKDGRYLLTASDDGTAILWQVTVRRLDVCVHNTDAVSDATFSPDGRRFLATDMDGTGTIWATDSGQYIKTLIPERGRPAQRPVGISKAVWCDQRIILADQNGTVFIWADDGNFKFIRKLKSDGEVYDMDVDPTGKYLLIAGNNVRVVETASGNLMATLPYTRTWKPTLGSDGSAVLTAGDDGTPKLWSIKPGQNPPLKTSFQWDRSVRQAILVPGSGRDRVWILDSNGNAYYDEVDLRDLQAADQQLHPICPKDFPSAISEFRLDSRRHQILITRGDGQIEVRDAYSGERLGTATTPGGNHAHRVVFSPQGELILATGPDKVVRLWAPGILFPGMLLATFPVASNDAIAEIDRAGTRVLIASGNKLELHDVATPRQLARELSQGSSSWWERMFGAQPDNLLQKDLPLLATVVTGVSLSEDGRPEEISPKECAGKALELLAEAKGKLSNADFFEWLFCPDDKMTIFPGSKITPTEWEKNATPER